MGQHTNIDIDPSATAQNSDR